MFRAWGQRVIHLNRKAFLNESECRRMNELCAQISIERDALTYASLVAELNQLLKVKEERLKRDALRTSFLN